MPDRIHPDSGRRAVDAVVPALPLRSPVLIGRDAERDRLTAFLDAARAGRGRVVVISGEAGAGKTRLIGEVANTARQHGDVVLQGRATETSDMPYRPFTEALLAADRAGALAENGRLDPFRAALGRLVPAWAGGAFVDSDASPLLMADGLVRLLGAPARQGATLLVLEDLHWADPDTLAILDYIADAIAGERVACFVTTRPELRELGSLRIAELVRRRAADEVRLGRLSSDASAELVVAILGKNVPSGVARLFAERSDGLPYLLEELLDAALSARELVHDADGWTLRGEMVRIPDSIAATTRQRLDSVDAEVRRVVATAAVAGPDIDVIAASLGGQPDVIVAALRSAAEAQLMSFERGVFGFRHALAREAVLEELGAAERAATARAAAPWFAETDPSKAAEMYLVAGDPAGAGRALVEVARRALDAGALATAEAAAARASAVTGVPLDVAVDADDVLAEALALAGHWRRVFEVGSRLLDAMRELDAPAGRRALVHLRIARAAIDADSSDVAGTHLVQARQLAASVDDSALACRVDALEAHAALDGARVLEARRLAALAVDAGDALGLADVTCEALHVLARIERLHDLDAAARLFERARAVSESDGLELWRIRTLHELGIVAMIRDADGDPLAAARDAAFRAGLLAVAVDIDHQLAGLHIFRLDGNAAAVAAERAAGEARRLGLDLPAAVALVHAATGHGMSGHLDRRNALVAEAFAFAGGHPHVEMYVQGQAFGLVALLREERDRALDGLGQAIDIARSNPGSPPGAHLALWPLLRAVDGDPAAAEGLREYAGGSVVTQAGLAYAAAVIAGRSLQAEAAAAAVQQGDGLAAHGLTTWRALCMRHVAEAALRDGWGDPATWLREALAELVRAGHSRLAAACRTLLREAGAPVPRPRRESLPVPAALAAVGVTAREAEVLRLVVTGRTNAEIAGELVLSVRTVEKHVESLLAKTGARSRRELVALPT